MNPGDDCLRCHSAGGAAANLTFTVAGTVFPMATAAAGSGLAGVAIDVTDSNDTHLTLQSNAAGNFYTTEPLTPPFHVGLRFGASTFPMQEYPPSGACNGCHAIVANQDGTFQTILTPPVGAATGFSRPPGHLYVYPLDGGCPPVPSSCPGTPPSFANQVQAITEGSCLPCHTVGGGASDFPLDSYDAIHALGISNLVQVGGCKMPPAGAAPMSPEEATLLIDWLACGGPQN